MRGSRRRPIRRGTASSSTSSRTSAWPCSRAATPSRCSTSSSATPSRRLRAEALHPARRGARPPVGGAALARPEPRAHRGRRLLSRRRARARLARTLLDHRRVPGLRRRRQLWAPPRAAGAAGGARQHGGVGGRRRERHRDRLPRPGAAAERIVSGPRARARGAHRALGGLADHDLQAVRVDLRLLFRRPEPPADLAAPDRAAGGLARRRRDRDGRDDRGGHLRLAAVHHVRRPRRPRGHPRRGLRGRPGGRRVPVDDLPPGDAAAAEARPARGRRAQRHLRLQLLPDRVDAQRSQPGLRSRHDDHLHVQDRLQERAARRRPGRGAGRGQRGADPGGGRRLSEDRALGGGRRVKRAALGVAGCVLAGAVLAPYGVMLLTALKPDAELRTTPPRLLPLSWRPGNFLEVLADPGFSDWLRVSLVVAAASTAIFVLDLVNTYTALILTNAAFNLAFAIWILRAFFASIPREIEEAAAVDGCGRLGTLGRVILPLSLPGLATAVIFAFIAAWNEYIVALTLMTAPERKPLTVGITSYVTAYVQHWNHLFAASVIAIVPVVVLFALIERHLVGGLTAGSVK